MDKTKDFIERAKKVHGDKYIYNESEYNGTNTKLKIICPEHGEFWQTPNKHINRKQGCPKCGLIKRVSKRKLTLDEFITKSNEIHKGKYIYTEVNYENSHTKVKIICPEHGEFWQKPYHHLQGRGCPACRNTIVSKKLALTTEEFIEKARKVHGDKYDYNELNYENSQKNVDIICPIHGKFSQKPYSHLNGRGCPICNKSNIGKEYNLFHEIKNKINEDVIYQYRDKNIFGQLSIDIFIPKYNIAIEYQGSQHFYPNPIYGDFNKFLTQIENDKKKYNLCLNNNIILLYANFDKYNKVPENYLSTVYRTTEDLINKIKEIIQEKGG